MRKTAFIIAAILFLASPCLSQELNPGVLGASAAASGPNAWMNSCTATPLVEPAWSGNYLASNVVPLCSPVTVSQAGTATKLSIKSGELYTEYGKLNLTDAAGNVVAKCSAPTASWTLNTWMDCDLATPYVVTATTYYICSIEDINSSYVKEITTTSAKNAGGGHTYADFYTYTSFTLGDHADHCWAMRVYVQ